MQRYILFKTYLFFTKVILTACGCDKNGSNGIACNSARQCNCKSNFKGLSCNSCNHKYFGFPACQSCQCNPNGSINLNCNANGRCSCKSGYTGQKCNTFTSRCPGWKIINGICYNRFSERLTWDKARHRCSDMGAILVEPRSSSEERAVASLMKAATSSSTVNYWMGISDQRRESK